MQLPINKDGNIELDLWQIVSEVVHRATKEERQMMVEYFGMQEPIRKWMVERLADEYSRPNYYAEVHKDRLEFLRKIQEEELDFYASLIVGKMVDEYRHSKAYWKLYRWCSDHGITRQAGFPHQALKPSDWNWKLELENAVKEIIKTERPDLLEAKRDKSHLTTKWEARGRQWG